MLPFLVDPEKHTICNVIRRWAEVQPEAPALVTDNAAPLSYSGLVALMDNIRAVLNDSGLGRGDRIGVVHSGGADMMSLLLGIMSGATAVPFNPNFSIKEFTFHLGNAGVTAVVIETGLKSSVRTAAAERGIRCLEVTPRDRSITGDIIVESHTSDPPRPSERAEFKDHAVVLSTSGTTTVAKVVPLGWREIMAHCRTAENHFELGPQDCSFNFRPLYYRGPLSNCTVSLYSGGQSFIAPRFDADSFLRNLVPQNITWLICGPTYLNAIHKKVRDYGDAIRNSRLRFIRVGTSRLDSKVADEFEQLFGVPIIESFSSTETGLIASNPNPPSRNKRGTVGIPLDSEVAILGLDGSLQEPGGDGEVLVRGPGVIDRYENDDAANAEAFVDGWFRTGDEGFLDADGYLVLTGRIKEIINRGGEKVSPPEVDAAMMSHPKVIEATSFAIPHPTLGEEVAAAVVIEPGATVTEQDLSRYLLDRLTGFKVPRCIVFTDEIPKSDAGKVQRHKLAEELGVGIDQSPTKGQKSNRKPSPLEYRLLMLWKWTLKNPRIGLDDNFFMLGGDSLQAVDLVLQMEKVFKCRLPVATLFKAGTVAEMAVLLEDMEHQGAVVPIQTDGDLPPFFCIHAQGGEAIFLYQLSQLMDGNQPLYGIQSVGWDTAIVPFTRAQDMAEHYVAEMRKVQPQGPYYIGGYSFGGRIAVYMANILKAAGEDVAILALIDTLSLTGQQVISLGPWLERQGAPTGGKKIKSVWRYTRLRAKRGCKRAGDRALRMVLFPILEHYRKSGKPLPATLRRPNRCNRLMQFELQNMPTYDGDAVYFKAETGPGSLNHPDRQNMPTYDGDAVYFKAETGPGSLNHPDRQDAWDRIIKGKIEFIPSSGRHRQMMVAPHIQSFATSLTKALARARER
jgi:acyl-CoA synthetase (AMP-forming)/AMP-acid ligase II/thioesterase domain-containing protein/acyl carrier protein